MEIYLIFDQYFSVQGSFTSTLDTNKYKFLTKISLDDLEIVKCKLNLFLFEMFSVTIFQRLTSNHNSDEQPIGSLRLFFCHSEQFTWLLVNW